MKFKQEKATSFTISKNLMQDINKILEIFDDEEILFKINENQCLIVNEKLKIKTRILDGNFPNIQKIIPTTSTFSYSIKKVELSEALSRVVLLTEKDESVVSATVDSSLLKLKSSHKFLGAIEEHCQINQLQGNSFKIAFDPKFVLDALHTISGDTVRFEFIDEISGFIIKNVDNSEIINVVSPIRIN